LNPDHRLFFLVGLFVIFVAAIVIRAVFFLTTALFFLVVASAAMGVGRCGGGHDDGCCNEE
jgi:hypothetical protein